MSVREPVKSSETIHRLEPHSYLRHIGVRSGIDGDQECTRHGEHLEVPPDRRTTQGPLCQATGWRSHRWTHHHDASSREQTAPAACGRGATRGGTTSPCPPWTSCPPWSRYIRDSSRIDGSRCPPWTPDLVEALQARLRLALVLLQQLDAVAGAQRGAHLGEGHAGAHGQGEGGADGRAERACEGSRRGLHGGRSG